MKFILHFIIFFLRFFIYLIELWQYRNFKPIYKDEVIETLYPINLQVKTDSGPQTVTHIHLGRPAIEYRIFFENDMWIGGADDHPLITHDYKELRFADAKPGDLIITEKGTSTIVKIKRMPFKLTMIDLTISHLDHRYFANGVLVHNCVHPFTHIDTEVNKETGTMPIFELFYRTKSKLTLYDKLMLGILRASYKLRVQ